MRSDNDGAEGGGCGKTNMTMEKMIMVR